MQLKAIETLLKELAGQKSIDVSLLKRLPQKKAGTTRTMTPEGRKRIADAQKKRWAEHRKKVASTKKAAA